MAQKPDANVVPLRKSRSCPICGKPSAQPTYPFCSERCSAVDLNRWLKGAYAIPAVEDDDDAVDDDRADG